MTEATHTPPAAAARIATLEAHLQAKEDGLKVRDRRIATLEALVKEAGDRMDMFLRYKRPIGGDCYEFRLTSEHIRWAKDTLARIKENIRG